MNNQLFSSDGNWKDKACVNYSHAPMHLYISGYKKAADLLAWQVVESGNDQDDLVYPIVFLYRQYLELQLKSIIKESRILLSEGHGFPMHHKIKVLWELVGQLMKKIIATVDSSVSEYITAEDFTFIDRAVMNFVEVDPDSIAFRYPENKRDDISIEGLRHINIRVLAESINELDARLIKFDLVVGLIRDWQKNLSNV